MQTGKKTLHLGNRPSQSDIDKHAERDYGVWPQRTSTPPSKSWTNLVQNTAPHPQNPQSSDAPTS